jgi:uncharacterized protein
VGQARFVIDTNEIEACNGRWRFVLDHAWFHDTFQDCELDPGPQDGNVTVEVTRTGRDCLVRGRLDLACFAPCARCLQPAPVTLDLELAVLYVVGAPADRDDGGGEDEDRGDVESYDGRTIELDGYLRDTVLLEIPMYPRCESDCRLPVEGGGNS